MSFREAYFFESEEERNNVRESLRRKEQFLNTSHMLQNAFEKRVEFNRGKCGFIWSGELPELGGEKICVKSIHNPEASVNNLREEFDLQVEAYTHGISTPRPFAYIELQDNTAMLIMQYVRGKNLRELKAEGKKISVEEYKSTCDQLKNELEKLHKDARIYHRDLHEENIILGDDGKAYIIDFGDAKGGVFLSADESDIYSDKKFRDGKATEICFLKKDENILKDLREFVEKKNV